MSLTVCLGAYSLHYIQGGAYFWAFLNWALGLHHLGCRVIWLDSVLPGTPPAKIRTDTARLQRYLGPFGLAEEIAIIYWDGTSLPDGVGEFVGLDVATQADLFLNLGYGLPPEVVQRFRRSAFIDIDPGLTQTWLSLGQLEIAPHDVYFTYGETVGQPRSRIDSGGLTWCYTPPPVFLPAWPDTQANPGAPYTTVSNWWGDEDWVQIDGTWVDNSKRAAYLDYLDLPMRTSVQLELALPLAENNDATNDLQLLARHGWRLKHVSEVSSTPAAHRHYVQQSRGEFSCMKRGYILLDTAWTSERTLNYLASGRPAVIQHTGESRFLPDAEGLFRFRSLDEAARCLAAAEKDYDRHSRAARALVEEYYNATKVLSNVLQRALP
jgi:hypothetical protein